MVCKQQCFKVLHLQVYAKPVYDMIEYQLVKRRVPNGFITRFLYRTTYIVLVAFIGITIPFFGGDLSAYAPLPHCIGLASDRPVFHVPTVL